MTRSRTWTAVAALAALIVTGASSAKAEDFLSALFGAFNGGPRASRAPQPVESLPFASEGEGGAPTMPRPATRSYSGGSQAYCVRTCDGLYFPIGGTDRQSRVNACNSFCPASETKVVYGGGSIDNATTDNGKSYSELPNAFRYRNQIVDNCTCNGKDHFGLAKVDVEHDPTVRKGDIVASADGLMVAGRTADRRQGALNLSPASAAIRGRYDRVPVVASE